LNNQIENFFKQKTAYEIAQCLVGSEMCIRDRINTTFEDQADKYIFWRYAADRAKITTVSYTHLRAHETLSDLVCRLLLEKIFLIIRWP
ncbi:hypothetical protein, partial [Staphylococcus aureus]